MKTLVTIIFVLTSFTVKAQFSVTSEKSKFGYITVFTNDGWKTKQPIKAYRFNMYYTWIFQNKASADTLASKLKSYGLCIAFNREQELLYLKNEVNYQVRVIKP